MGIIYSLIDGGIEIKNSPDFNIMQTLNCGQIFRYEKADFGYKVYAGKYKVDIFCHKDTTKIFCENVKYVLKYFDFERDYANIKAVLNEDFFLKPAINFGGGIRILNQEPLETLISFIISANNNIPRIKKIINNICVNFGTNKGDYFTFPTLNQLSKISKEDFSNLGCGYRSAYLVKTINMINNGFSLDVVYSMSTQDARKYLITLSGVGRKVADCVLLFAYHKTDVFPTDTWIIKVYEKLYGKNNLSPIIISENLLKRFGELSGYAQQYLFYDMMSNKGK